MASNNSWSPLPQRNNGCNKKNRENQTKLINTLMEMFGTSFESDIIASVAQTCNWKLQPSIEALLSLTSTVSPESSNNDNLQAYDLWAIDPYAMTEQAQPIFDSASSEHQVDIKPATEPKVETASLCGLKVEYRPKGMENNSDDDADVVIEEETSDYRLATLEPVQRSVNVCQFLETPSVQCPPRNTLTKVNYINTASPSRSPARNNNNNNNNNNGNNSPAAEARIESYILKGYKVLVLMRGCPGSGKSYLARDIVSRTCGQGSDYSKFIFSTDDYFAMTNRGVYVFDASKLQDAHAYNQNRVLNAARQGWSPIIVDNTNTQAWEMQHYINMGVENGYIVETLEPNTPWFRNANELERRNKHNVPKPKIRAMLERYEPGLSGERLLRMFKLTYKTANQPPQLRNLPALPQLEPQQQQQVAAIPQRQPPTPKTSVKDKPQVCDALSLIAKEYSNLETVAMPLGSNSMGIDIITDDSGVKQPNSENWTEGSSYKEESLLVLPKLGAIGSERRVSNAGISSSNSSYQTEKAIVDVKKDEENLITFDPIGTEQKVSSSKMEEVLSTDNGLSQCWDFTLLLNGMQIHSKLDEDALDVDTKEVTKVDDKQVLQMLNTELSNEPKTEDKLKKPLSPNDSSSSSMSSLERVDMSQFDVCNNPEAAVVVTPSEVTEEKLSSTGGLGSILSFIKNSFLNNEKDKLHKQENDDKDKSSSTDKLTAKLRDSSIIDTSSKLSSVTHDAIESVLELSGGSDEFFEAPDSLLPKPAERVVEELLEASSDFQLVEQYDDLVTQMRGNDENDGKFVSEKNFTEQIKNLQVIVKFEEEDSKVLKEPIDRVFGGKNVFTGKMQDTSLDTYNALTPKPNNSSSHVLFDNVDLITWQEAPFPLNDVADLTVKPEADSTNKVETCDKETFTDPYDFNVAYIGGTDDYKVLKAFNRSINEPGRHTPDESPSHRKLLLHKGTMTTNTSVLLLGERFFELEIQPVEEGSSNDRGEELVERYHHLPRTFVLDVYENCQHDFNWALDYLDSLQHDEATVSAAVEQHIAEAEVEAAGLSIEPRTKTIGVPVTVPARTSESSSSSSLSSSPQKQHISKKEKSASSRTSSDAQLALKRQFEDKFVLSEESYKSHTLKVKSRKKRKSQDAKKTVVKQEEVVKESPQRKPSRLDHPAIEEEVDNEEEEEEYRVEDEQEETIELKLGYDFIRILEEQFGSGGTGNDHLRPYDGLFPVIQIRKSMAQELHALWIESMESQLSFMHKQLDAMIARDAEYARSLELEQIGAMPEPQHPNLKEIMDMEMALATFNNDRVSPKYPKRQHKKQKSKKESLEDMTSRVTESTLHDMFPFYESAMLHDIYEAHGRDFDETESQEGLDEACGGAFEEVDEEDCITYDEVIQIGHKSREEARRQVALRNLNYQKASEAYRRKNPEVAAYYADVAKLHIKTMDQANATAASAFLAAQAYANENEDMLDLHHLRVDEAMRALDIFLEHQLENMSKGARKSIFIITGRGARSINGQSRLKPAVAKKLNQKSINFKEANPGMLKVIVHFIKLSHRVILLFSVNYWKNLYTDYKEVALDIVKECRERPIKASIYATIAGGSYYCAKHNPDEVSFREQLISSSLKIGLVGEPIRNPVSVFYTKWLEQCYNEGIIRRLNLGVISFVWLDNYDKGCALYKTVCPYLKPRYVTFYQRIVDVGFLDNWWILDNSMTDYDVNDSGTYDKLLA
ncbi:hypothetical protein TSAR_011918 [Trichomalopsis sarcophagae]|uniref:Smr domain-containing protein n=1 Tax=Trichomalopsis sarcophagae TaxID=543379 RepID=A0A232F290_9HYME|nr:hypothetical protein TSAR_011918 [Trichomalopsis sarcophagae]